MKKTILMFMFIIFFISSVSADIILTQPLKSSYNLGDSFSIPVTIKSLTPASGYFQMDLICGGNKINFHKESIDLSAGEEKKLESSLTLTKSMIGELKGRCKIKSTFNKEYKLTKEFTISDELTLSYKTDKTTFNPGETLTLEGNAIKKSGGEANGFVNLEIISNGSTIINQMNTIKEGFFTIKVPFPKDMKAGNYLIKIEGYEKDLDGIITNKGFASSNIKINQVPTSLEIAFENKEVEPGTNLKVKTILHDQTGQSMNGNSIITIKDGDDKILKQEEKKTNEFLEFPIKYNELPSEWKVFAISNKLDAEAFFNITEKEKIEIKLINETIIVSNKGNIKYCNKSISVKIGNETKKISPCLDIDESKKYTLTAPDGEYNIEILSDNNPKITGNAILSGKVIQVDEAGKGMKSLMKHPFIWIFVIIILGIGAFLILKKIKKKNFFAYFKKRKNKKEKKELNKTYLINTKNRAELSLSMQGDKQNSSLINLKIKNLDELKSKTKETKETLQKIAENSEKVNASIYENKENLFFIFAPTKTKTFKNEMIAINLAQKIQKILKEHNKLFKQKIEFGISLNYGTIIAKQENNVLYFMSLGKLISKSKKIASISNEEILLSEEIRNKLMTNVKTKKQEKENTEFYTITEIKDKKDNKKFIDAFVKRLKENKK